MDWWKRLKMWQKSGILLATIHIILYLGGLVVFSGLALGYFVTFLESPWMILLSVIFGDAIKVLPFNFGEHSFLIYGTFAYGLFGSIIGLIVGALKKRGEAS